MTKSDVAADAPFDRMDPAQPPTGAPAPGARSRMPSSATGAEPTTGVTSEALSALRYTLLVVGTKGERGNHFMVANWGTQASFDPWRFVLAIKNESQTLANARRHDALTVNMLDAAQAGLVREILSTHGADNHDSAQGPLDAPRLPEAFAGFDGHVLDVIDTGGDHAVVILEVVGGWHRAEGQALLLEDLGMSYAG